MKARSRIPHLSDILTALTLLVIVAGTMTARGTAAAQQVRSVRVNESGEAVVVETPVQDSGSAAKARGEGKPGAEGESKPGEDGKPKSGDEKKDGESGEKKDGKPEGGPIKRPLKKADESAKPIAEEIVQDDNGGVTFDLKGQSWDSVLQWLADASKLSLDWQELPGDTLNLTTTRAYTLEEARDVINRHLLARGYSIVVDGELMSVLNLADVKSSLVPRVEPEQLATLPEHTLCKVSFDLKWLLADEAVEELAPLLSKAGKISKLSRTNRLEIMDTAGSLRDIYDILQKEQSDTGQEQLVKMFRLEHRRAGEVLELLRSLLGLENDGGGGRGGGGMGDVGQITNMMRQMQQQLQQMGNSGGKGGGGGSKREDTKTRLVLNQRENMIVATAMPDQMAIIEKAIREIDIPLANSDSLLQNMNKMKIYRLETVDPQTLVDLLQELGDLAPGTVLKVDNDKKSIVAFAGIVDHLTITTLVERLDQSGRNVEVIQLKRLDAEYVAGTIRALMAPPPKEDNSSRYSYYSRYSEPQNKAEEKEFKVEPDIENNRLLVYANKVEMDEIMLLLQKLGEIPDPDAVDDGIRVFDLPTSDDPREILRRVQELWRGDNELQFDLPETETPAPSGDSDQDAQPEPEQERRARPGAADGEVTSLTADEFFALLRKEAAERHSATVSSAADSASIAAKSQERPKTQLAFADEVPRRPSPPTPNFGGASKRPPVKFSLNSAGQLIVTSDDKQALAEIEDLMRSLVPPLPNYKVFELKYATPSWVTLNLKDYFKAEEETESGMEYDWYWGMRPTTKKKSGSPSLGRHRIPTFIYDNFTSTILVRDADRRQLKIIEDLIAVYDVPEPADTRSMRVTKIFRLENSKAEVVAQAVKDVFRDLLSANDKALEKKDGEKQQTRVYSYFGGGEEDGDEESPIRFKGLLSIGIDPNSDTLVVSSTASLMETVGELIQELDKAGERSTKLHVLKVDPTVDIALIQERLSKALGTSGDGRPKKNQENKDNPMGGPQPNGRPQGDGE
ncbi:MAG: secretin N-terminal domain-containing protein [Planctomycetaceae bacterium]